ncbi:MAG TPA: Hpt domain-containing protein [Dokdonella sp.]
MRLHEDGDFTALGWIKPALDATLGEARAALEAYVEHPANLEPMRACVAHLHQVQGTLRMVELYGAAMVVENMERLAEALVDDAVKQREEAYSVLMRGMVQLPDYLERLQSGHKDIPIVLLPLLNDLRACRGENLLTESALFAPDLGAELPDGAAGSAQPLPAAELRAQALRLRLGFQAALLKWFRDERGGDAHLRRLVDVLDRLRAISHGDEARRLWWIAAGVVEAVERGALEAGVSVKLLFGRVDREIHRFAGGGEAEFASAPPRELVKNLLYYVAHASDGGPRTDEIRRTYRLDTLLPTAAELQHAQGSMTGRNRNLLDTVSAAIKDDLLRVKETLDIFLRSRDSDPAALTGQVEVLDRVADTLGMLGLGMPRRVVGEQRDVVEEMAERRRPVDEGALLDVAGALLYVEASLDDHIERLGAGEAAEAGTGELELPQAEVRKILDALMREAAVNLQQAKHDIVAFVESPWDHTRVEQIPRLLEEITGALRMLGLADAAEQMTAFVRFVEIELIRHRRVPTAEQMDKLADALASIEYYLEATREQRRHREKILDVARESLEALGYWPPPARPAGDAAAERAAPAPAAAEPTQAPTFDADDLRAAAALAYGTEPDGFAPADEHSSSSAADAPRSDAAAVPAPPDAGSADWIEIEEEVEEEVPQHEEPLAGFRSADGEEIDDGIREVFVEEVEEEIAGLERQVPLWKRDVDDLDTLKPVRRAFHTLKGSGRLVGASALGDFGWRIENLLNRVLDGSVAPSAAVVALVDRALGVLPSLLAALRGERIGGGEVAAITDTADRLAAGEEAWVPEPSAPRTIRRKVVRRVPAPRIDGELPALAADVRPAPSLADEAAFGADAGEIVAGPLPNLDPVLFDILQSEVAAHLGVIDDYLARCASQPVVASEPLLRAAHTLNGAIAMVDIPTLGNVLGPLESYVKRLRGHALAPDADGIAALGDTAALTREVMQRLAAGRTELPDSSALAARVAALRDRLPEPEVPPYAYADAEPAAGDASHVQDEPPQAAATIPESDAADPTGAWLREAGFGADAAEPPELPTTPIPAELVAALAGFDADALSRPRTDAASEADASQRADVAADAEPTAPAEDRERETQPSLDAHTERASEPDAEGWPESTSAPDRGSESGSDARRASGFEADAVDALDAPAPERTPETELDLDFALPTPPPVAEIEPYRSAEPEPFAEPEHGLGAEPEPAADHPPGADRAREPASDRGSDAERGLEFELDAESEPVLESTPGIGATTGLDSEPEREWNLELSAESGLEFDAGFQLESGSQLESAPQSEPEPELAAEPEREWNFESSADSGLELESELPSASESEPALERAPGAEFEPAAELDSEAEPVAPAESKPEPGDVRDADAAAREPDAETIATAEVGAAPAQPVTGTAEPDLAAGDSAATEPPTARSRDALAGSGAPPFADDPQPDGPLEGLDIDDDLLDIFVQEAEEILDQADARVAGLRAAPHERAHVVGLQRDLHTLKGGARMAGLAPIADLSHAMESLIDAIADGRRTVDRAAVESLERGFDRLHGLVQRAVRRRAIAMPVHAIAGFESLVTGRPPAALDGRAAATPADAEVTAVTPDAAAAEPAAADHAEPAAEAPAAPPDETAPPPSVAAEPTAPPPRHLAAAEPDESAHAPQEMIRVRADLLDALVNYAGEVSIYRSRLEQQISTFRFNLVEFEQTVTRLREQLRKLEIETEAQIIARYQREQHDAGTDFGAFDPLELDRFSQLQQLSRALGESVSDLVSIQGLLDELTRQSETLLLQQSRVSSDLQEGLMRTRMVPFDSLVPNLRRTLRQAAQELGKRAQLRVDGARGEMDRNLLERMKAPFEHMLRNALAHGIEPPDERVAAGKPAEGVVAIAVSREATEVVLRVADDGRGMDREAIRRKAIERGLLKPDVALSDRDLYGFVLESGFSTAEQVTQLAGRGVGMDVVHSEIKQLGGSLAIDSTPGQGTTFTIRLPFTLAVTQAILVRLGETSYAVPMSSVQGVARISREDLERRFAGGDPKHVYAGEEYTIYDLAHLLGQPRVRGGDEAQVPLLMTRSGDQRAAVRIDGVVGSREIVVKSVGPQISSVPGIFGATIMGDGSVVIILDLAPLVRRLAALRTSADGVAEPAPDYVVAEPARADGRRQKPLVMVVDDSITMRKVTTRVLERADLDVVTAKDGLDALEKLQDNVPDLMLLDIEMPRMDGYELATYMRNDPRMKQVPIVMITSRTGEKHRQRALEIGVDRYLGKPYQEDDLLRHVQEILRSERG